MSIVVFENTSNPPIYIDVSQSQIIYSTLYKIGRTECIRLISDIYHASLSKDGSAVKISFINQGFSNTVVLRILVGEVRGESLQPKHKYILKLGKYDDVHTEYVNYSENLTLHKFDFIPDLLTFTHILERWAAILYQDLGEIQTFQDLYIGQDDSEILISSLDSIFSKMEEKWYKNALIGCTRLYSEQYNLLQSFGKYQTATRSLLPTSYNHENVDISIAGQTFHLKNPLHFLLTKRDEKEVITHLSVVHGDFHGANILVDNQNQAVFAIDFANMKPDGHIFKDYVKLEANIVFRLFDYDVSKGSQSPRDEWFELIAFSLGFDVKKPTGTEVEKAWKCIRRIRERAHNLKFGYLKSDNWSEEYLVGLLHWTLSSIYWIDIFNSKKLFAFSAAALICEAITKKYEPRFQ